MKKLILILLVSVFSELYAQPWSRANITVFSGLPGSNDAYIHALAANHDTLYAGGNFQRLNGVQIASGVPRNVNRLDMEKIKRSAEELKKYNFHLIEKSAINLNYLSSTCRRIKKKHGLDLIIVDYLQLMRPNEFNKNRNTEAEVAEISSGLKMIAKDFNVPVIALAQLSRQAEQRGDKRPMLSDLRSSGSLEQDADMVLFLYRPSYYHTDVDSDPDYKGTDPNDYSMLSEMIISKHRNGDTGLMIKENFNGAVSRFWSDNVPQKMSPNEEPPF